LLPLLTPLTRLRQLFLPLLLLLLLLLLDGGVRTNRKKLASCPAA